MSANRAPGTTWELRRDFTSGYVRTLPDEEVCIVMPPRNPDGPGLSLSQVLIVPRKDARLLAKRINQCLDSTAKP